MVVQQPLRGWIDRISQVARKSPRKVLVLGVLVLVMAVMWGRVLLKADPNSTLASVVSVLDPSMAIADPVPVPTKADPATVQLQQWLAGPIKPLTRDLFRVNLDLYPVDPSRSATSATDLAKNIKPGDKSQATAADVKMARQVLIENLRQQASELKLQSTMMGVSPKALINGELVGEGDVVASFRVVKIEARGIVVEQEGIQLEILMK